MAYAPTIYADDTIPPISAENLNKSENELVRLNELNDELRTTLSAISIKELSPAYIDGKYINSNAVISDNAIYKLSSPIRLNKNEKIQATGYGDNSTVSIIALCQSDGTPIRSVAEYEYQSYVTKEYTATEDCYVCISGRNNKNLSIWKLPDISSKTYVLQQLMSTFTLEYDKSTKIANGTDLNNLVTPGVYYVQYGADAQTILNTPTTTSGFKLIVMETVGASNRLCQIALVNSVNVLLKVRFKTSSSFGNWDSIITDTVFEERIGEIEEEIAEIKGGAGDSFIFKAILENPSECEYKDYPVRMMINFPKGICHSKECIVISNGTQTDIPFDFYPCRDENPFINNDYTYHNDGSIKSGTLVFLDTLSEGEKKEYTITVSPNPIERNWIKLIEWTDDESNAYLTTEKGIARFNSARTYYQSQFNGLQYSLFYGFKDSANSNHKENDSNFKSNYVLSTDIEVLGDGYSSMCLHRKLVFSDRFYEQYTTLFANGKLESKCSISFTSDSNTKQHYIRNIIAADETPSAQTDKSAKVYNTEISGVDNTFAILYCNGNTQRTDQSLPIYTANISETLDTTSDLISSISLDNTQDFLEGYSFSFANVIQNDSDNDEIYRIFNNLVTAIADKQSGIARTEMLQAISGFGIYAREARDSQIPVTSYKRAFSEPFNKLLDILTRTGNVAISEKAYQDMLGDRYNGEMTIENITNAYETNGLEYVGRSCPISYYLLKLTNKNEYATDLLNYGKFIAGLIEDTGDVPLHSGSSANSNSRCMGLYALALAHEITTSSSEKERFEEAFGIIKSIIDSNVVVGTIQPDGNILTSRYLHYTAFANFYYNLAIKHYGTNGMSSNYNYIFDATLPSGEIKDLSYCVSDSRRGKASNYAYIIGVLALSENPSAIYQAKNVANWLANQMSINGQYPEMLDGYTTATDGIDSVGFALVAIVEMLLNLF